MEDRRSATLTFSVPKGTRLVDNCYLQFEKNCACVFGCLACVVFQSVGSLFVFFSRLLFLLLFLVLLSIFLSLEPLHTHRHFTHSQMYIIYVLMRKRFLFWSSTAHKRKVGKLRIRTIFALLWTVELYFQHFICIQVKRPC